MWASDGHTVFTFDCEPAVMALPEPPIVRAKIAMLRAQDQSYQAITDHLTGEGYQVSKGDVADVVNAMEAEFENPDSGPYDGFSEQFVHLFGPELAGAFQALARDA